MRRTAERFALPLVLLIILCLPPSLHASDVPYDVDIVFMGLMSFVPGSATATVIIPNVKAGLEKVGDDMHTVDGHLPYILADKKTMPANHAINLKHDFYRAQNDGDTYHYIPLQGEELALDASNNVPVETKTPLDYKNSGSGNCPVKDDVTPANDTTRSLYWLSSMQKVLGSAQTQDTPHFTSMPDHRLIVSRAVLNWGTLEAHVIKPGVVWDFTELKPPYDHIVWTQSLAQEVHWKFKASGEPFILNLFGFDGNSRRLAFMPQNGKVIIFVANTTPGDTGALKDPGNPPVKDPHYSAYYQFIYNNAAALGPIPVPRDEGAANSRCKVYWEPTLKIGGPVLADSAIMTALPPLAHAKTKKKTLSMAEKLRMMMPMESDPSAGGLNCSSNQWP